jgi:heme exporter protein D
VSAGASVPPSVLAGALSAGRYAAYVWPAYAVTLVGFVWMILDTVSRSRAWRRKADRLEKTRDQ